MGPPGNAVVAPEVTWHTVAADFNGISACLVGPELDKFVVTVPCGGPCHETHIWIVYPEVEVRVEHTTSGLTRGGFGLTVPGESDTDAGTPTAPVCIGFPRLFKEAAWEPISGHRAVVVSTVLRVIGSLASLSSVVRVQGIGHTGTIVAIRVF